VSKPGTVYAKRHSLSTCWLPQLEALLLPLISNWERGSIVPVPVLCILWKESSTPSRDLTLSANLTRPSTDTISWGIMVFRKVSELPSLLAAKLQDPLPQLYHESPHFASWNTVEFRGNRAWPKTSEKHFCLLVDCRLTGLHPAAPWGRIETGSLNEPRTIITPQRLVVDCVQPPVAVRCPSTGFSEIVGANCALLTIDCVGSNCIAPSEKQWSGFVNQE
jgi:hypothetical protein